VVKGCPSGTAIVKLAHVHAAAGEIDLLHLVEGAGVDVLFVAEGLRCTGDERINVVDNLADVVGNPSG
jgi:hypothetical protein